MSKIVDTLVVRVKVRLSFWDALKLRMAGVKLSDRRVSIEQQMYDAGIWEKKDA